VPFVCACSRAKVAFCVRRQARSHCRVLARFSCFDAAVACGLPWRPQIGQLQWFPFPPCPSCSQELPAARAQFVLMVSRANTHLVFCTAVAGTIVIDRSAGAKAIHKLRRRRNKKIEQALGNGNALSRATPLDRVDAATDHDAGRKTQPSCANRRKQTAHCVSFLIFTRSCACTILRARKPREEPREA
jgi:hypothetical protein